MQLGEVFRAARQGGNRMALPAAYSVEQKSDERLDKVVRDNKTGDFVQTDAGMLTRLKELHELSADPRKQRDQVAPYAQKIASEIISDRRLTAEHRILGLEILGRLGKLADAARDEVRRQMEEPDKDVAAAAKKVL